MRKFVKRLLVLGLAVLPAQAQAQRTGSLPAAAPTAAPVVPVLNKEQPAPVVESPTPGDCATTPGGCATTPGGCTTDSTCQVECAPPSSNCVLGFADYLYWKVHGADIPFAQQFDGADPTSPPRGPVGTTQPSWHSGFRVGAGGALNENSWLVGTYTDFRTSGSAELTATDPFVLHSNLAFPNTVNAAGNSDSATANSSIQLRMADADYKCRFINNDGISVNWLAGVRYAHLEQDFSSTYPIFGTTTIDSHIRFDGAGPRTGLEGQCKIACGFFGYGKGVVSLLAGEFSGNYEQNNTFTGLVGQTSVKDDRIVPVLELELGAGWQSKNGRIRLTAGYYVGSWFNTMTIPTLADSIQHNNFTGNGNNFRDTITFDGLVTRLEFRY